MCAHGWYLSIPPLLRPKKSAQLPGIAEALQVEDFPSRPNQPRTGLFLTISLAGFHLGTMADAVMYFIRHGEGQLQSTWGRLAKQASKAPASTAVVS